jgi:hypothetical protein
MYVRGILQTRLSFYLGQGRSVKHNDFISSPPIWYNGTVVLQWLFTEITELMEDASIIIARLYNIDEWMAPVAGDLDWNSSPELFSAA